MHDVLNLLIFGFFCVLVMFEDIVFVIFPDKRGCLAIFPLLMLAVVFNILCEARSTATRLPASRGMTRLASGWGRCPTLGSAPCLCPRSG